MLTAHNLRLVPVLLLSLVSTASAQSREELFAHDNGRSGSADSTYWVAHVTFRNEGETTSRATRVYARPIGSAGGWKRLAELSLPITSLADFGGDAAILYGNGDWQLVAGGAIRTGQPLPAGQSILALADGDDALWAMASPTSGHATTAPTTQPLTRLFFAREGGGWNERARLALPVPEASIRQSIFAVASGQPILGLQTEEGIEIFQLDDGGEWTHGIIPVGDDAVEMKFIRLGGRLALWLAGESGGGGIHLREGDEWTRRFDLEVPGIVPAAPRAVVVVGEVLRLLFLQKDDQGEARIIEQGFDLDGNAIGEPSELKAPAVVTPVGNRWVSGAVMIALVMVMLSTFRRRRDPEQLVRLIERTPLAPHALRFMAGLVDLAPFLVAMAYLARRATFDPEALADPTREPSFWIGTILYLLHTTIMELITARSPGKLLFGLRVINLDGGRPAPRAILMRNFLRLIDLVTMVSLAFVLISPLRQRVGDIAANTTVIRDKPREEKDRDEPAA